MTDWRTIDGDPAPEFTPLLLARRPLRREWGYGVGKCLTDADGKVQWCWTSSGDPTHWAPITAPEEAE